jgi:hypothetical protein
MSRDRAHASIALSIRRLSELEKSIADAPGLKGNLERLQNFQAQRLASTYLDIAGDPRYRPAVEFFLTDLYGPKTFEARDREFQRAARVLGRMLPLGPLETLAQALELQTLTLDLDWRVARELAATAEPSSAEYRRAYRACGDRPARERQIALVVGIARGLEHAVHHPSIEVLLRMAHLPATLAGFGTLQLFLERGFEAFRRLKDIDAFIKRIEQRELAFMNQLFASAGVSQRQDAAVAASAE